MVHSGSLEVYDQVCIFLRSIGIDPLEWSQAVALTQHASPFIGQVLDEAFLAVQAVVVLLTPDEVSYLQPDYASGSSDPETKAAAQARPNVLFEAGMAFGRHPERTVIVEFGQVRPFPDVAGRLTVRLDDTFARRQDLALRLKKVGCHVNLDGTAWHKAGNLEPPPVPGGGLPLGKKLSESKPSSIRPDARYSVVGRGKGRLTVFNKGTEDIYNVVVEVSEEESMSFRIADNEPLKRLPAGRSKAYPAMRFVGPGSSSFDINIKGRTEDGISISEAVFIDLYG